jgi:hypothetical protein
MVRGSMDFSLSACLWPVRSNMVRIAHISPSLRRCGQIRTCNLTADGTAQCTDSTGDDWLEEVHYLRKFEIPESTKWPFQRQLR